MKWDKRVYIYKRDGEWSVRFEELVEEASGTEPPLEHRSPKPASHSSHKDSSSTRVCTADDDNAYREEADTLPTDLLDTSDSEPDNKHNDGECKKCTNPHDGKLIMQQQFSFNINQMFTMIFTNSKFNTELQYTRKTSHYKPSPWETQNGLEYRQIRYTLRVPQLRKTEVHVTETQVINECSKPGALYSIDCTSDNAGFPYADCFSVCVHYCLQRVTKSSTMLSLYGQVKFKRFTMFKSLIEKDSIKGLEDFCCFLESKLKAETETAESISKKSRRRRPIIAPAEEPVLSEEPASCPAPTTAPAASCAKPRVLTTRAIAIYCWLAIVPVLMTIKLYFSYLYEAWSDLPLV